MNEFNQRIEQIICAYDERKREGVRGREGIFDTDGREGGGVWMWLRNKGEIMS